MSDNVSHPSHYTAHPSGVECIAVTRHMVFTLGNAVKYAWRCDDKGKPVEDLRKALQYLDWYWEDTLNAYEDDARHGFTSMADSHWRTQFLLVIGHEPDAHREAFFRSVLYRDTETARRHLEAMIRERS